MAEVPKPSTPSTPASSLARKPNGSGETTAVGLLLDAAKQQGVDVGELILNAVNGADKEKETRNKKQGTLIVVLCSIFIVAIVGGWLAFTWQVNEMKKTYLHESERILVARDRMEATNSWESLPVNQRKEKLREFTYSMINYYTNITPVEQKMNDDQLNLFFEQTWLCTTEIPSVNFFLPLAYIKVATNFNPVYNVAYRHGIASMYLKTGERIANLPLIRNDKFFQVVYRGGDTLNNPSESIKLLVARIDDLMQTFNNREDWVLLALFTDEYDVISNYWKDGTGAIPDSLYTHGDLADALKYYHAFRNWQIPVVAQQQ
jgi:hypothetical protein